MIEDTSVFVDLPDLFKAMAESLTMLSNSAPAFNVETTMPNLSTTGAKPIIYVSNLALDNQTGSGCQHWEQKGRITVGVKAMARSNYRQADQQFSIIFANFSASRWQQCQLSFTFKAVPYVNAYISQFGLYDLNTKTTSMYTDVSKNEQVREMSVSFTLRYKNTHVIQ